LFRLVVALDLKQDEVAVNEVAQDLGRPVDQEEERELACKQVNPTVADGFPVTGVGTQGRSRKSVALLPSSVLPVLLVFFGQYVQLHNLVLLNKLKPASAVVRPGAVLGQAAETCKLGEAHKPFNLVRKHCAVDFAPEHVQPKTHLCTLGHDQSFHIVFVALD
jgi:hypothetical protein